MNDLSYDCSLTISLVDSSKYLLTYLYPILYAKCALVIDTQSAHLLRNNEERLKK